MALSKSSRIILLLTIDTAFFLLELVVGYAVHSLALVADSFHMLNDVLSLCVGLWAVKVANQRTSSKMYTYGWQRAETLGALVNGVFLVALCLSIFLEAIQRFVEPQTVSNPRLVLIVGGFGLLSNILGLFLFHEHGDGHGGSEHSHGLGGDLRNAEEGSADLLGPDDRAVADERGNIEDVLPEANVRGWSAPQSKASSQHVNGMKSAAQTKPRDFSKSDEENTTERSESQASTRKRSGSEVYRRHSRHTSSPKSRGFGSVDDIYMHPASFRQEIIAASRIEEQENSTEGDTEEDEETVEDMDGKATEDSPLVRYTSHNSPSRHLYRPSHSSTRKGKDQGHRHDSWHISHIHAQPKPEGKQGRAHSHGDLNMRGVFLHVMGDALGNIGVIASALFIWLTSYNWRYYVDPAVSLVITIIILLSAVPLCKAAARILLQAVPHGLSVDDIKQDIEQLPGILSTHHLHVWQLSDTKLVASLHVQVDCDLKNEGSDRYMHLARQVRQCLHEYGIHSSTIQPEFCSPSTELNPNASAPGSSCGGSPTAKTSDPKSSSTKVSSRAGSMHSEPGACLLDCGDECALNNMCCPTRKGSTRLDDDHPH